MATSNNARGVAFSVALLSNAKTSILLESATLKLESRESKLVLQDNLHKKNVLAVSNQQGALDFAIFTFESVCHKSIHLLVMDPFGHACAGNQFQVSYPQVSIDSDSEYDGREQAKRAE